MKFQRLLAVSLLSLPVSGFAADPTASLNVTANVLKTCAFAAGGSSLSFGDYNPQESSDKDAISEISVTCTNGTPFSLTMNGGENNSGSRRMKGGNVGGMLPYELYKDSSRQQVWGDTVSTGYTGSGSGVAQQVRVYGRIQKNQWVAAGAYQDTVTVTLSTDGVQVQP